MRDTAAFTGSNPNGLAGKGSPGVLGDRRSGLVRSSAFTLLRVCKSPFDFNARPIWLSHQGGIIYLASLQFLLFPK